MTIGNRSEPRRNAVVTVLDRSMIAGAMRAMARALENAAPASRSGALAGRIAAEWRRLGRAARLRATGTVLVTAAVVHLALLSVQQVPAGWLWLAVPAIVLVQGLVLLAASRSSTVDHS